MKQILSTSNILRPLIRPILKNPWDCSLMEFRYGLWTGVSALMGEDGRQLGEHNTRPLVFNREIPAEVHACKYKGSRYGREINISALRVAMRHFYEASAITVAVRDYHMAEINKRASDLPGGWDLYAISRAAIALICYRYRYGTSPLTEKIPNDISSLYKLVTGIFVICREMMRAGHPAASRNDPISSETLYAYADDNDIFGSSNGMVCAGSAAKITEFLEFANVGRAHAEHAKLGLDGEEGHLKLLGDLLPDVAGWYDYALQTIELDHFVEIEILSRKIENDPETQDQVLPVLNICRAQHAYWLELLGDREQFRPASFEQAVLNRQNAILTRLHWAPVDAIPEKILSSRLCR